jgi:DNA-directed RNA polymerase specialized sigma24 family protein
MSAATQFAVRPNTETGFARLLAWLDDGAESNGERYLEIRQRLVAYFDRRNRPAPDALADETFDRVARTLEEDGQIRVTPPARYCFVVAKYILLEDVRRAKRYIPLNEARPLSPSGGRAGQDADADRSVALGCLDRCLDRLKPEDRTLIVEYYRDAKKARIDRRRDLAAALGVTMNALGIRTWRLRAGLETCVTDCQEKRR